MRSFNSFSFWLTAVILGLGTVNALTSTGDAQEGAQCVAEICGEVAYSDPATIQRRVSQATAPTATRRRHMTNARRLALGLPLNPPSRRDDGDIAPQVSPAPQITYEGMIEVRKLSDGSSLGYVSALQRASGIFKYGTGVADAVKVSFALAVGATSGSGVALVMSNSEGPLLGLVQGRDSTSSDIGTNTFNYLYFNGIELPGSPSGSTPASIPNTYTSSTGTSRTAESSVWNVDLSTGLLTVQWINTDGTSPTVETWGQSGYMYAGGSSAAFFERYPSPITLFTLHFVPL